MSQTSKLKEWIAANSSQNKTILKHRAGLLYHYRAFDGFWKIISSDLFWATNSRFSNDSEERNIGIRLGKERLGLSEEADKNVLTNHFITCFFQKEDLLSYWRGYAPYGGVSMGLSFNGFSPFTLLPFCKGTHDVNINQDASKLTCFTRPLSVQYLSADISENELYERLNAHSGSVASPSEKERIAKTEYMALIPYIKHNAFEEEAELRIVINRDDFNGTDAKRFDSFIHYIPDGDKQKPIIALKPGNPDYDIRRCIVRILIPHRGSFKGIIARSLIEFLKLNEHRREIGYRAHVIDCADTSTPQNDTLCFGCSRRGFIGYSDVTARKCAYKAPFSVKKGPLLRPFLLNRLTMQQNSIYISQGRNQRAVFEAVHEWATDWNANQCWNPENSGREIKVWCEGHLPIRSIMIGPCKNKAEMKESIADYCRHSDSYWLRDVEIKDSGIPYRVPPKD